MGFPSSSNFPGGSDCKEPVCKVWDMGFLTIPGSKTGYQITPGSFGKIPQRREWQPTPVFLPGEFYGEKILVGYRPWGCKEWNMTEHTNTFNFTFYIHLGSQAPFPLGGNYGGFPSKNQN